MKHEVAWTPERIRHFWDFLSTNPAIEDLYFAKLHGRSITRHVRRKIPIGTVLDLGCGRGDLIEHLLPYGDVYGSDQSPEAVAVVTRRFGSRPRFKGAYVGTKALPQVDTVFVLETVEHLNDEALAELLSDAHRLLKPGGHLVLTTPNEEDLGRYSSMCPECGCVFHQMQHVRSWSARTLTEHVARFGFRAMSAEATVFSPYSGLKGLLYRVGYRALKPNLPHLIYIGAKA